MHRENVDVEMPAFDMGVLGCDSLPNSLPEVMAVAERIALVAHADPLESLSIRVLICTPDDPLDTFRGVDGALNSDLVRGALLEDATDAYVKAFCVLTKHREAHVIDGFVRQRTEPGVDEPTRPQVDVEVEVEARLENQLACVLVPRHAWISNGAEKDGVTALRDRVPLRVRKADPVLEVTVCSIVVPFEVEGEVVAGLGDRVEDVDPDGDYLFANPVTGNHRDAMHGMSCSSGFDGTLAALPGPVDGVSYLNPLSSDRGPNAMSEYTIQRGDRTFRAQKLETLRELARRGYLGPDDLISVDGGPFAPARVLEGLGHGSDTDEPWPQWSVVRADARGPEPEGTTDLLSDFLSGLEEERPRRRPESSVLRKPTLPGPSVMERAEPPSLQDMASIPSEVEVLTAENLQPLDEDDLPPAALLEVGGVGPMTDASSQSSSSRGDLRLVEPVEAPQAGASTPLSFDHWIQDKSDGSGGHLLENFGVVDDGIIMRDRTSGGVNWWRTGGILLAAVVVIAFGHTWVRTVAQTTYPSESELVSSQRGDGPSIPGETTDRRRSAAPQTALDMERRLRARVAGDIKHFGDSDELENVMFAELMNLGIKPLGVDVEAIRLQSSGDYDRDRPVEANITIRLAGVEEDAGAVEGTILERITLAWFVVAKYSLQGKVSFREVRTSFGLPSRIQAVTQGRDLQFAWSGRGSIKDLLLKE